MKKIILIPARLGSTRLPQKPLKILWGKPLICHVLERALKAKSMGIVDGVFVATDHEKIAQVVRDSGGKAILTRKDHPCGTDRIQEASEILGLKKEDLIINIQGDQPLFPEKVIKALIEPFEKKGLKERVSISTLSVPFESKEEIFNSNKVKVVTDSEGFALYFSRSPIPYIRDEKEFSLKVYKKHVGVYVYKKDFLDLFIRLPESQLERLEKLEQLRALEAGYKIFVIHKNLKIYEVDTQEDLDFLESHPALKNLD